MVGNGKLRRWRISFHRSFSSSAARKKEPPPPPPPPAEFLCPISKYLMFDPAVVTSGQTFERTCVQVCSDFNFTPTLPDGSEPDFSTVIPNLTLKTAILNWCSKSGSDPPNPPLYSDIESLIRPHTLSKNRQAGHQIPVSETELLLTKVTEAPPLLHSRAATELNGRGFYSSSSSQESVIANGTPLLPFATRPSCFSYSSSPSNSSEFLPDEVLSSSSSLVTKDETYVNRMTSLDVYEQEQAVIQLRKATRSNEDESRLLLCTERILLALKQLLNSRYPAVQTNATAAIVNLSLEKANKIKIVRAGIVPYLIELLRSGFEESREHAAGAIFSLALENENKTMIGVLGALQPLLHELRSGGRRSRHDAALALYHLSLEQSNRVKIIKLGAVGFLLGLLRDEEVSSRVVLVVCNLAACEEGRAALLDANGVEVLVGLLRNGSELDSQAARENVVAALFSLSQGSLRFKGLARDAGAEGVLRVVAEIGSERAREKARRILEGLRGREDLLVEGEDVDWEAVMQGRVTRARYRVSSKSHGTNSTEF